jgi:hypothetical protein
MSQLINLFGLMFSAGLAVIGYECYIWARYGYWTTITSGYVLYYFNVDRVLSSWIGINRTMDWWLSTSLAENLFVASIVIPSVFALISSATNRKR